jgi:chemotaxis protein MotC
LIIAGLAGTSALALAKQPYEIVRSLEALHDQMVLGSKASQAEMPVVLRQLGARLMAEDPMVWRDPRNAHAVVVYILSGGEIKVARAVLESGKISAADRQLIEGALAYLEGDKEQAKSLLNPIDPRTLEPGVGSHVALAQAALLADDNSAKAMNLLDMARVFAPGTLVEDAALRREVFLAEEAGDFDKFIAMSDQYFRRFRSSVYADSFHRSFAVSLTRISQNGDDQQLAALGDLLNSLSTHEQLHLYLEVAQYSLFSGKVAVAKWAGEKAALFAEKNSAEMHRAALYDGAAAVLTTDYERGVSQLKAVPTDHVGRDEAVLVEAALDLAGKIRQWPQGPADKNAPPPDGPVDLTLPPNASKDLPPALNDTVNSSEAAMAQAQKALSDSDALLQGDAQ